MLIYLSFSNTLKAQIEDPYENYDTVLVYNDGKDIVIEIQEDSFFEEEFRLSRSGRELTNTSGSLISNLFTVSPAIQIQFGASPEIVNQGLFGINVSGMFTQNTLPIGTATASQWQSLSDLVPEVLRFPGGEFAEFAHPLYQTKDINLNGMLDDKSLGYGFDLLEIFRYFDKSDGVFTAIIPTEAEMINAYLEGDDDLIQSWVGIDYKKNLLTLLKIIITKNN